MFERVKKIKKNYLHVNFGDILLSFFRLPILTCYCIGVLGSQLATRAGSFAFFVVQKKTLFFSGNRLEKKNFPIELVATWEKSRNRQCEYFYSEYFSSVSKLSRKLGHFSVENSSGSFESTPLEGASAGLFSDATISIHGMKLASLHVFQKEETNSRGSISSVVPRMSAEAAAVLSIKKRTVPPSVRSFN